MKNARNMANTRPMKNTKTSKNTDNTSAKSSPFQPPSLPFRTIQPAPGLMLVLAMTFTLLLAACGQQPPLVLAGTVEAKASDIVTETSGRIVELLVSEGATVTTGDVIARLDGAIQASVVSQLEQAVVAKAAMLAELQNGATDTTLTMAEADLAQSEAALTQGQLMLERYTLRAPCDGTITLLSVNAGEVVNAGATIGTISQLDDLSVRLYMPQRNLAAIHLGDSLSLMATSFPGKPIPGEITFISDKAEFTPRNTETTASKESTVFRFEVAVSQPDSGLKPGMALEVGIPGAYSEQ